MQSFRRCHCYNSSSSLLLGYFQPRKPAPVERVFSFQHLKSYIDLIPPPVMLTQKQALSMSRRRLSDQFVHCSRLEATRSSVGVIFILKQNFELSVADNINWKWENAASCVSVFTMRKQSRHPFFLFFFRSCFTQRMFLRLFFIHWKPYSWNVGLRSLPFESNYARAKNLKTLDTGTKLLCVDAASDPASSLEGHITREHALNRERSLNRAVNSECCIYETVCGLIDDPLFLQGLLSRGVSCFSIRRALIHNSILSNILLHSAPELCWRQFSNKMTSTIFFTAFMWRFCDTNVKLNEFVI